MNLPAKIPPTWESKPLRCHWTYRDPAGGVLGHVARYDGDDGAKDIIPFFKQNGAGYEPGAPPDPRPLFGLDVIAHRTPGDPLFIVEGEKCAAALHSLGLCAITSLGGANAPQKADWTPVKDFGTVFLLPDNDSPGEAYMRDVRRMLAKLPEARTVEICRFPDLPEGGDVVDWLQSQLPDWDGYTPVPREPGDDLQMEFFEQVYTCAESFTGAVEANDWESPVPLDAGNVPPWPMDVFPTTVQHFVDEVTHSLEVPPELPAMLTLSVLATACQGKFRVHLKPDYSEPLNIWTCCALPSGSRKTGVMGMVCRPLYDFQHEHRDEKSHEIRQKASERKNGEAIAESMRRKAARSDGDREALLREISDLEASLPAVPPWPQWIVDDVTPENLAVLLAENDERMALFSAEGGIFEILAGRYSRGMPNFDLFLKSHAGEPLSVNRQGREPLHLTAPALTIGVAPQPDVIRAMHDKPGFRGRGLLARILFAMPDSNLGERLLDTPSVRQTTIFGYHDTVRRMLELRPNILADSPPVPHDLSLVPEAYETWHEHRLIVEAELRPGGVFEHLTDWAGKFPGAIARIAGILHVAEHATREPWKRPINLETMNAALRIGEALKAHAIMTFDFMGADPAVEGARYILQWIRRTGQTEFSRRDCHYSLKHRFGKATDLEMPLQVLVDHYFIRPQTSHEPHRTGRPSMRYNVNPETHMM